MAQNQYPTLPERNQFANLKGHVVVVTGGASGIGASLTTLLHTHGAHVVFGDVNVEAGEALVKSLDETAKKSGNNTTGTARFMSCDVCKYDDMHKLFRTALDQHGRVAHAVYCAGLVDGPTNAYFDPTLSVDAVGLDPGNTRTLDVNFLGACAFARIALPFLVRRGPQGTANPSSSSSEDSTSSAAACHLDRGQNTSSSLTFISSVTGFRDAPGMFLYQTSKQALLGLMRAMRVAVFASSGIRVNAVCPGMTETPMTSANGFIELFKRNRPGATATEGGAAGTRTALPSHYQSATAVAEHIVAVLLTEGLNGRSIYVEEGKGWDFEEGLAREMPRWLGEEPTRLSDENLRFFASLGAM